VSVVIYSLRDCIARPDDGGRRFGLIEHVIAVAERCGRAEGPPEQRLAFLAGLLHDAAKAAFTWQEYIRKRLKKGSNHAPLGGALFAFWADNLIPCWTTMRDDQKRLFDLAVDWTRIVYDHHSAIRDLSFSEVPWVQNNPGDDFRTLLAESDCEGLIQLVRLFFPESSADLKEFATWQAAFEKSGWQRRLRQDRGELLRVSRHRAPSTTLAPLAEEGFRLAELGARLIFADRSHAADWDEAFLTPMEAERGCLQLGAFCGRRAEEAIRDGASPDLVRRRGQLGATALGEYRRHTDRSLFTLVLPTGCGKTVAGLRIALEACRIGRCRRIVYVAPYLSILSQAAAEIQKASDLEVFVHHHLSATLLEDHQAYDVLETWQTPVLATTFNQLCRALFPARAQQCLRIPALDQAFLLVDEPQILDPAVWNLFLKALEVAANKRRCQVLFLTATLPPTRDGLDEEPTPLVDAKEAFALSLSRYVLRSTEETWDPDRVSAEAADRLKTRGSVAVILNTVRDAIDVFERARAGGGKWLCLTARMLPGHKAHIIRNVRERLDPRRPRGPERVGVVSSQVIEAGIDLSFHNILRARPIYSSVIQAAGRANRHGEGPPAEVVVFPFLRGDGTDSRPWVYREEIVRVQTDAILALHPLLNEQDVPAALAAYYREWWQRCNNAAVLGLLNESAKGEWSKVAGLKPFADDLPRTEVFVPGADAHLTVEGQALLARFGMRDAPDLLAHVQDPAFRRSLDFLQRKRLSGLIRQCTVSIPERTAEMIAEETALDWLWVLREEVPYREDTGLALGVGDDTDVSSIII
jgi:CRISPR-associated endonuclease/helicase Cas3